MTQRELAFTLLRCSGAISTVSGLFYTWSYVPMLLDEAIGKSGGTLWKSALFPSLSGIVGAVVLFSAGGPLEQADSSRLEMNSPNNALQHTNVRPAGGRFAAEL